MLLFSCKKGDLLENVPPETNIFLDEINLAGEDRLTSEFTMHWSGDDIDGFVTGYELSFDAVTWDFVTTQDTIFSFDIPEGSDSVDVEFWVRAVDDKGAVDPTPAYLIIPIKNSPPTAAFDTEYLIRDTAFLAFSLRFIFDDLDGDETLDSAYLKLNDGDWFAFSPEDNFLTLVPEDVTASGPTTAEVYAGVIIGSPEPTVINGLNLDGDNTLYVKVVDLTGSSSIEDTSSVIFVKNKKYDLLVLDSHDGGSSPTPETVYFPVLNSVLPGFDYINLETTDSYYFPTMIATRLDPSFQFMLESYDQLFWFTDETKVGDNPKLHLDVAGSAIQDYLNVEGKKILISTTLPTDLDSNSTILEFSPIDSLSTAPGQARILTDSLANPTTAFATAGYLDLTCSSSIFGADPFYPKESFNVMYTAHTTSIGGWSGPDVIGAITKNADGKTNQVFLSVELHKLNGNPAALEDFLDNVLNNEFDW